MSILHSLFAHVPYSIHDSKERYYHALLQMAFTGANIDAHSDYLTDHGRIDLVANLQNYRYIIEVKFKTSPEIALAQIHERRYYERFLHEEKPIILLGLSFDRRPRDFSIKYATEVLGSQSK